MPLKSLLVITAVLSLSPARALCQSSPAPIVQPGAPGQPTRVLPPGTTSSPARKPSPADISFMQGMIMHHNQAVEMTALLLARTKDPEVRELGKRISISQTDEMGYMKRWLDDRGLPLSPAHSDMAGMDMAGMDMKGMDMGSMPMMPGMLTPQQMEALRNASEPEFDHLFLTGMIQHHTGALTMVKDLFATPGAGQDPILFDFATDVDNTQLAEIDIMRHLLQKEKQ